MDIMSTFFKSAWSIIGPDIVAAVQNFFETTSFMPKQINCAYMSLIPKVDSACAVKDFRPVACCSVLYKIISKVLSNRMQHVLDDIIGGSQSSFVKSRVIFDNVILSHELVMVGNTFLLDA